MSDLAQQGIQSIKSAVDYKASCLCSSPWNTPNEILGGKLHGVTNAGPTKVKSSAVFLRPSCQQGLSVAFPNTANTASCQTQDWGLWSARIREHQPFLSPVSLACSPRPWLRRTFCQLSARRDTHGGTRHGLGPAGVGAGLVRAGDSELRGRPAAAGGGPADGRSAPRALPRTRAGGQWEIKARGGGGGGGWWCWGRREPGRSGYVWRSLCARLVFLGRERASEPAGDSGVGVRGAPPCARPPARVCAPGCV